MTVLLTLGDVQFQDMEIPENLVVGGAQRIVLHKLVGGARVIDTLGADPDPLVWSGMFLGSNALQRALTLQRMRDAGQAVQLSFSQYAFQVVIAHFAADFQAEYRIPYRLTCEVQADYTGKATLSATAGIDSLINGDLSTANSLTSAIGNSSLSSAMASVSSAVSAVSSFASAAQSTIKGVLAPINAMRVQVKTLIAAGENTLQNVTTLGGILPNNPIAQNVARLTGQVNTMLAQPQLTQLDSVLSRMSFNVSSVNASTKSISVMSGNLFDQAAKLYHNVEGWSLLSQANPQLGGDPNITAPTTIAVPPLNSSNNTGGVPNV